MNQNNDKLMHIVFITDDNYVKPTLVAVTSLLKNSNIKNNYIIHLICKNISRENEEKFIKCQQNNVKIDIIRVNPRDNESLKQSHNPVSLAALLKFDIATILKNVDKVLYLDGDVIIRDDLTKLYNIDITEYYCAAVPDGPRKKVIGGKKHSFSIDPTYFNSGVMLLNLKELRRNDIPRKLLDYRLNCYNYFMDQDAFNQVFKGHVRLIPYNFNTLLHIIMPTWKMNSPEIISKYYNMPQYNSYEQYINNSSILHYTFSKPWKYYDIPMADVWSYYYYLSPLKNELLERDSFYNKLYNSMSYRLGYILTRPPLMLYNMFKRIKSKI